MTQNSTKKITRFVQAIAIISGIITTFFTPSTCLAAEEETTTTDNQETFENATVIEIKEEEEYKVEGIAGKQIYQKLKIKFTSGDNKGKTATVEVGGEFIANSNKYKTGDKVIISSTKDAKGDNIYFITDYQRTNPLIFLTIIFIIVVLASSQFHGLRSLGGLIISLIIVFAFIIPQILDGKDAIFVSIMAGIFLIPTTFYISHGFKRQTTIAILGTLISIVLTGIMAHIFIKATKITGMTSEDTFFLQMIGETAINIPNLIIGGIIISAIGILDDVTISQTSIVQRLHETDPNLSATELFKNAMKVGKDHISSMVNTLVLTYTGASIPLLLLFSSSEMSTNYVLNYEAVAIEIVRTLVSSIGLVLAIPLTTILATYSVKKRNEKAAQVQMKEIQT